MARKCDILYIHSTRNPTSEDKMRYPIMPMGIIAILNGLKAKGYDVLGVNMAVEFYLDPQFQLSDLLKEVEYRVLMTDLHWYEHSFGAMYVAEHSKKIRPEVPVVIGGYTATLYADEIAKEFPSVDYIVTGDSELPMEQLVDCLLGKRDIAIASIPNLVYREGSDVAISEKTWVQTTLDTLDFVPLDVFAHKEYIPYLSASNLSPNKTPQQWLCIARGCKYNCAYCCGARDNMNALFRRCEVLVRSPEKISADFLAITEKGIQVCPSHDLQMFGKAHYKEVFSRIREAGVKPMMYLECFQLPSKDFIDEVACTFDRSNTILEISPISGNEQLRSENGKLFSNDALYETVAYIISKGIKVQLYYTVNVVGETEKQFQDTFFQMRYLRMVYSLRDIFYQRVVIDPLAGMRKWEGVNAQYNSFMDYYHYCQIPHNAKLSTTGFEDRCKLSSEKKVQMYNSLFARK